MPFVRRFALILLPALAALPLRAQIPVLVKPLPNQDFTADTTELTVDLAAHFTLPGVTGQVAQIDTVAGKINIELFATDAPKTVANFLAYVTSGRYRNTFIHRAVPGFVVQGGGYTAALPFGSIARFDPVANERRLSNVRGTVAMAKLPPPAEGGPANGGPDSATSEWFFNLADNSANLDNQNGGFTVFARVLGTGMEVVDTIAALPRFNIGFDSGNEATTPLRNVPANETQLRVEYFVTVADVKTIPVLPTKTAGIAVVAFSVKTSDPAVVTGAVNGSELTLTAQDGGSATVTVTATDSNGNAASGAFAVTVPAAARAPTFTAHPQPLAIMAAGAPATVVFAVAATGVPAPTYQWQRNDEPVAGATRALLVLPGATAAQAGNYACVVKNSAGSAKSIAGVLAFIPAANPGRLVNLSLLTALGFGETMTMGTVLGGAGTSGPKPLLARAAGPSLAPFGVTGVLPDPQMSLVAASGATVATNNDWGGDAALSGAFAQVGAFAYAADNSRDAAIYQPALAPAAYPASYTVQVKDAGSGSGTVIAELYDATPPAALGAATPRLVNVSVLKQIAAGGTLTAGFVLGGASYRTVLVRAIGPGLAAFGVDGAMADPQLTLFNGTNEIAANDDWGGDAQLTTVGTSVGAFRIENAASKDAVLLMTLGPGNYSAQVTGTAAGRALVEVYEVP